MSWWWWVLLLFLLPSHSGAHLGISQSGYRRHPNAHWVHGLFGSTNSAVLPNDMSDSIGCGVIVPGRHTLPGSWQSSRCEDARVWVPLAFPLCCIALRCVVLLRVVLVVSHLSTQLV